MSKQQTKMAVGLETTTATNSKRSNFRVPQIGLMILEKKP